jgi:hypothetical protein
MVRMDLLSSVEAGSGTFRSGPRSMFAPSGWSDAPQGAALGHKLAQLGADPAQSLAAVNVVQILTLVFRGGFHSTSQQWLVRGRWQRLEKVGRRPDGEDRSGTPVDLVIDGAQVLWLWPWCGRAGRAEGIARYGDCAAVSSLCGGAPVHDVSRSHDVRRVSGTHRPSRVRGGPDSYQIVRTYEPVDLRECFA